MKRALRDGALLKATDYVINDMKGTKVVHTDGTPLKDDAKAAAKKQSSAGMSIAGWVCIGLVVLLAIWLVIGVIRALTGSSGGGAVAAVAATVEAAAAAVGSAWG